jgi:hypothetical protein
MIERYILGSKLVEQELFLFALQAAQRQLTGKKCKTHQGGNPQVREAPARGRPARPTRRFRTPPSCSGQKSVLFFSKRHNA